MTVRIWDEHLLAAARRLCAIQRGSPRVTDLRRAVSTAYYALFHATLRAAADSTFSVAQRSTLRYRLAYRSVDHRYIRDLCRELKKDPIPEKFQELTGRSRFSEDFRAYAAAIVSLQELRHLADYDPVYKLSKLEAEAQIEIANAAIQKLQDLAEGERTDYFSLLFFQRPR